jgi:hypothetical protein
LIARRGISSYLIIEGEQCARAFLRERARVVAAVPLVTTSG